ARPADPARGSIGKDQVRPPEGPIRGSDLPRVGRRNPADPARGTAGCGAGPTARNRGTPVPHRLPGRREPVPGLVPAALFLGGAAQDTVRHCRSGRGMLHPSAGHVLMALIAAATSGAWLAAVAQSGQPVRRVGDRWLTVASDAGVVRVPYFGSGDLGTPQPAV